MNQNLWKGMYRYVIRITTIFYWSTANLPENLTQIHLEVFAQSY